MSIFFSLREQFFPAYTRMCGKVQENCSFFKHLFALKWALQFLILLLFILIRPSSLPVYTRVNSGFMILFFFSFSCGWRFFLFFLAPFVTYIIIVKEIKYLPLCQHMTPTFWHLYICLLIVLKQRCDRFYDKSVDILLPHTVLCKEDS